MVEADEQTVDPKTAARVAAAEAQIVEQSKRIEFFLTEFSIELLASKMKNEDFIIPQYQRNDNWEPERKSRFIESILMGLPIPFLFFWESPGTGKLEIVDGSQRLRTIQQFLDNELVIGVLDQLDQLEGLRFCDLPESRQRKIKNRSIRGIVLNEHADEQARFDIFERINTGSMVANKAEIRRGALIGPFLDLVIEIAKDEAFAELAPVPEKSVRLREREELVTRFFAYGDGLDDYHDRPSDFLFQYAKKMNARFTANPTEAEQYRQRFMETMTFVTRVFPHGFRRTIRGVASPRARFEAIAIGSYVALKERPELATDTVPAASWAMEEEFRTITGGDGANGINRLKGRIDFVRRKLVGE